MVSKRTPAASLNIRTGVVTWVPFPRIARFRAMLAGDDTVVLQLVQRRVTKRGMKLRNTTMEYANIIARVEGPVGIVTLNRPKALNALNGELLRELCEVLEGWDRGDEVRAI